MFNSWIHIKFLSEYFNSNLTEVVFEKPFTYKKQELNLPILHHTEFRNIRFLTKNPLPLFTLEPNRPKPNQKVNIFSAIEGLRLEQVKYHYDDRFMLMELSSGEYLLIQIFGPNGNIYYLDQNYEFKSRFIEKGRKNIPDLSNFTSHQSLSISKNDFINILDQNTQKTIVHLFKSALPFNIYQDILIEEICYRSELDKTKYVSTLDLQQKEQFYSVFNQILQEISNKNYRIYQGAPPIFCFCELKSLDKKYESFNDIINFTENYIRYYFGWYNFSQKKQDLRSKLNKYQKLLERKIDKQKENLKNFPTTEEYRKKADTLLAYQHKVEDHVQSANLPDVEEPEKKIEIELDPELTIPENADKFYKKSKRVTASKNELKKEIKNNQDQLKKVKKYLSRLDEIDEKDKLKELHKTIPKRYLRTSNKSDETGSKPYKHFTFRGWDILVGKSAQKNHELTFHVASKNDFWLHAQKIRGSHVIVRNPEKKESMPDPVLRRAAGIAAFYSQAKSARSVPVIYTKKKYVWTRKSLPPGKVFHKYEDMIVASPYDPRDK